MLNSGMDRAVKFSNHVDPRRVHERTTIKPLNHWDFIFFEDYYYPRRSAAEAERASLLQSCIDEFGKSFSNWDEVWNHCENHILETYKCCKCGMEFKSETARNNHEDNRTCRARVEKNLAEQNGEEYIPESEFKVPLISFFRAS